MVQKPTDRSKQDPLYLDKVIKYLDLAHWIRGPHGGQSRESEPRQAEKGIHMRVARSWCSKYGSLVKETRAPWRLADFQLGLGKIQALLSETKEVLRD